MTFSNSSTGATTYEWDFGDGITSTTTSPVHVYSQSGSYTVTLTAKAGEETGTLVRPGYITVNPTSTVTADFAATPLTGTVPLTVTFSNSSTNATAYEWDFGDGITSTAATPVHVYTSADLYTVVLTATGAGGRDTRTRTDYIYTTAPITGDGRVTDGLQTLYPFQEGSGTMVHDTSGTGTPLDLAIGSGGVSWLPGGGLAITSSALISSTVPATKIISASMATDEMTIEAWVKPANTTQDGPARIVTLSEGSSGRNFTLGQGRWGTQPTDVFDVRLRTTATDNGGRR